MEFQIKCHLGYEISGPASFLFNVAVAQNSFQRIITEHLEVAGAESCQEILIGGQRYYRLTAQRGRLELSYAAVVDATHELLGDPSRIQVPLFEQIPAEAMVFIYPSRFCQSDLLARLAKREFKQDESGFYLFDPTRLAPQSSFVRIGQGRDAADTAFATIFGGAVMNKMELAMRPGIGRRDSPEYTIAPISNYPSAAQSEKQSASETNR